MTTLKHRVSFAALGAVLVLAVIAPATPADARQNAATSGTDSETYLATVTDDNVYVRSGPADSYYPFGKVRTDTVVKVTGQKYNWARIVTEGPAFREWFGYVKIKKSEEGSFRVAADGKTGRALGRLDLLAPNLNTNYNPRDSWKRIRLLEPDTVVEIIERMESDRDLVFKVALPARAEGWISSSFVQPASEEQILRWRDAMVRGDEGARDAAPVERNTTPPTPAEIVRNAGPKTAAPPAANVLARETPEVEPVRNQVGAARNGRAADRPEASPSAPGTTSPVRTAANQLPTGSVATRAGATNAAPSRRTEARTSPRTMHAKDSFADLEKKYEQLRAEPIESAEVLPLQQLYRDLVDDSGRDVTIARYASARAEQLSIWADLQVQRQEINQLRTRAAMTRDESDAVKKAIERAGYYSAVGRLTSSTIFDGHRLPKLYRLQEPTSGRTIAYIRGTVSEFDLGAMLDQIVGVVGEKDYDGGLRLNVIEPRRIDLLAPQG